MMYIFNDTLYHKEHPVAQLVQSHASITLDFKDAIENYANRQEVDAVKNAYVEEGMERAESIYSESFDEQIEPFIKMMEVHVLNGAKSQKAALKILNEMRKNLEVIKMDIF